MNLPLELQEILARRLSGAEILSLCRVSRYWSNICSDDTFWSALVKERFFRGELPPFYRNWRNFYFALESFSQRPEELVLELYWAGRSDKAIVKVYDRYLAYFQDFLSDSPLDIPIPEETAFELLAKERLRLFYPLRTLIPLTQIEVDEWLEKLAQAYPEVLIFSRSL